MGGFIFVVAVGVAINLITAFFSRQKAIRLLPWVLFYIGGYGLFAWMESAGPRGYVMKLAERVQFHWWSYLIISVTAVIAAIVYWAGLNAAVTGLANATAHHEEKPAANSPQTSPPPTGTPTHTGATGSQPHTSQHQTATGSGNAQQQQSNTGGNNLQQITTGADSPIINNPVINLAQAQLGNLKERTIRLSNEIMVDLYQHGWFARSGQVWNGMVFEQMPEDYEHSKIWVGSRSRHFQFAFFQRVVDIRNEFAQLHLRDQMLDDFFKYRGMAEDADKRMAAAGLKLPDTPILPQEIETVAERLKVLAAHI